MSRPPDVDYRATSLRPRWETLPAVLRDELAVALGTEIVSAGPPVGAGFTGGFAAPVQLADGRRVFVKASGDGVHAYRAYQREAELVPRLPTSIPVPAIVATAHLRAPSVGRRWFAVASTHVDGRMPGRPWTEEDFARVTTTCEVIADAMTPSPVPGLELFGQDLLDSVVDVPRLIHDGDLPLPDGFQPWLKTALAEVADLVELVPEALVGDTATHADFRPDNLIIDQAGTCWTVDWNWLALGPCWLDWVGLLPYARYQGIDTAAALRTNPLTADVPAEYLDAFAAVLVAYFLSKLDEPPPAGCTQELRRHQRLMGWVFLDWLAERRGW